MIKELRITNRKKTCVPWWPEITAFNRRKVFKFGSGLTILWGPNGCGKSSLLKALARLTHCAQAGIPKVTQISCDFFDDGWDSKSGKRLYRQGMSLVADGQPVHFLDPNHTPGVSYGGAAFDYDFTGDIGFHMGAKKLSSGQTIAAKTQRVLESLGTLAEVYRGKKPHFVPDEILSTLDPTCEEGKRTLLLDEPGQSIDFPSQELLWRTLTRQGQYQIIVATHSPFALFIPGATYLDISKGYLKTCREASQRLAQTIQRDGDMT